MEPRGRNGRRLVAKSLRHVTRKTKRNPLLCVRTPSGLSHQWRRQLGLERVALTAVAVGAEQLQVLTRRRAATRHREYMVVLEVEVS